MKAVGNSAELDELLTVKTRLRRVERLTLPRDIDFLRRVKTRLRRVERRCESALINDHHASLKVKTRLRRVESLAKSQSMVDIVAEC